VLSHGDYGHFGGLVGFLRQHHQDGSSKAAPLRRRRGLLLFARVDGGAGEGKLRRARSQGAGRFNLTVTYGERSSLVTDHGFATGQIGLNSFESCCRRAMKVGVDRGVGCYADKMSEERIKTSLPDQFHHEIAAAFNLKDRGLC
jgi:7,8-dihydropterin-6-yl-methyl-4-(beta-D-ribofuranosyl)aminobenzene 5'-phosphate synthase